MFNLKKITNAKFMPLIMQGKSPIIFMTSFNTVNLRRLIYGSSIKRQFPPKELHYFNKRFFLEGDKARNINNDKKLNVGSFEKHHFSQQNEDSNLDHEVAYKTKNEQCSFHKSKGRNKSGTEGKSKNTNTKEQNRKAEKDSSKRKNDPIGNGAPSTTNADRNQNKYASESACEKEENIRENFNFGKEENNNETSSEGSSTKLNETKTTVKEDPLEVLRVEFEKFKSETDKKIIDERQKNKIEFDNIRKKLKKMENKLFDLNKITGSF